MENTNDSKMVPVSIIVAGIIIAGAIYFGGSGKEVSNVDLTSTRGDIANVPGVVAPVTDKDHIVGSKDAEIVIVEYSDFDCPFCKVFHNTMRQVVNDYGSKVAWVYRHFPISSLHPNASKKSEASECVTEMGGNTAFWKFTDKLLGDENVTLEQMEAIVTNMGLDATAFNTCLNSGKFTNQIQADVVAATKAGAQGTPYSVIITKSGKKTTINGAQPLANVKAQIDALLK